MSDSDKHYKKIGNEVSKCQSREGAFQLLNRWSRKVTFEQNLREVFIGLGNKERDVQMITLLSGVLWACIPRGFVY